MSPQLGRDHALNALQYMKEVPQKPYWLRHSPANMHGMPVHPSNSGSSSVGAGVMGDGVAGAGVNGGLVGRSEGLNVGSGVGSMQVVKA